MPRENKGFPYGENHYITLGYAILYPGFQYLITTEHRKDSGLSPLLLGFLRNLMTTMWLFQRRSNTISREMLTETYTDDLDRIFAVTSSNSYHKIR